MKQETYNRARLDILDYVMNICIAEQHKSFPDGVLPRIHPERLFKSLEHDAQEFPINCIVTPRFIMKPTKWYLSRLIEVRKQSENSFAEYLLVSIDDGSRCWFSNCSLLYLPESDKTERWTWNDKQWEFQDKVEKAYNKSGVYVVRYAGMSFGEDGNPTVRFRKTHSNDILHTELVQNWQLISIKDIAKIYIKVRDKIRENKEE